MRKTLGACLLALLTTTTALAGEIPNDRPAAQEPADGVTLQGDMSTPLVSEGLTQTVLEVLAVLPSIL